MSDGLSANESGNFPGYAFSGDFSGSLNSTPAGRERVINSSSFGAAIFIIRILAGGQRRVELLIEHLWIDIIRRTQQTCIVDWWTDTCTFQSIEEEEGIGGGSRTTVVDWTYFKVYEQSKDYILHTLARLMAITLMLMMMMRMMMKAMQQEVARFIGKTLCAKCKELLVWHKSWSFQTRGSRLNCIS